MATLNLMAAAHVYRRNDRFYDRYECAIFNTNTFGEKPKETFAVAVGETEEQARRYARQIVAACDGAEA